MQISVKTKEKCVNAILEYMKKNEPSTKKEIIDGALVCCGLTPQETEIITANSKSGRARSYIATTFNDLLAKKNIIRNGDGYILAKEELIIVTEEQCETQILKMLHKNSYSKSQIYAELDKHFKDLKEIVSKPVPFFSFLTLYIMKGKAEYNVFRRSFSLFAKRLQVS